MFESGCHVLVNPVNGVGVMGAGLARKFAHRFPSMLSDYVARCNRGFYSGGSPSLHKVGDKLFVINLATKIKPIMKSELWLIENGVDGMEPLLDEVVRLIRNDDPSFSSSKCRVGIPKLGCGLGGLYWPQVRTAIVTCVDNWDDAYDVLVFGDSG